MKKPSQRITELEAVYCPKEWLRSKKYDNINHMIYRIQSIIDYLDEIYEKN